MVRLLTPTEIRMMCEDEQQHGSATAVQGFQSSDANFQDRWCPTRIVATLVVLTAVQMEIEIPEENDNEIN